MRTQFENNVYEAVQDYGVYADKEELIKALQFDRNQYEVGYTDGVNDANNEGIKEFADLIKGVVEFDISLSDSETEYLKMRIDEVLKEYLDENTGR